MDRIRARWLAALAVLGLSSGALAGETLSKDQKIARAMSAAPPSVSEKAKIVDLDGTVLREGTNGWTCMPGLMPGDDHPMCNDEPWMAFMKALGAKQPVKADRIGVSYMLQGDAHVSNADPFATDPKDGSVWVQEGPHLMILMPDPKALEGISDDPNNGGPYVMWKGTPYAHVMVPVAPRTAGDGKPAQHSHPH